MIRLLMILVLTVGCTHLTGKPVLKSITVDKTRLVKVIGVVDGSILEKADKLIRLTKQNKRPIYILLNSPGGSVFSGDLFISAMNQARSGGIKLVCMSAVYAASMAFNMLLHCDERYIFENTRLLFHPIRITARGEPLTAPMLSNLAKELQAYDTELLKLIKKRLRMRMSTIKYHYYKETFWRGKDLSRASNGFFRIVREIRNIDKLFQYRKDIRKQRGFVIPSTLRKLIESTREK